MLRGLLGVALVMACGAAALPGLDALRWTRRVVLVSAPGAGDAGLVAQRRVLAAWRREGEDRDVTTVEIVGDGVEGVGDTAAALRGRFGLRPGEFAVLLIGKDGRVAVRSGEPVDGATLTRSIDAMPMRRAGQR